MKTYYNMVNFNSGVSLVALDKAIMQFYRTIGYKLVSVIWK
jgi:hypothetical protein